MSETTYLLQLETPLEDPLAIPFEVRGWLLARSPIEAVGNGGGTPEWLELHDRPELRAAHPSWPHGVGFAGRLGAEARRDHQLALRLKIGGETLIHYQPLSPIAPPPDHLQVRQVGSVWGEQFYRAGRNMFVQIEDVFTQAGKPLASAQRVLDFGCGCGRVLRSFGEVASPAEVWGCDIDAEAIAWNQAHLDHLGKFVTNPEMPPAQFAGGFFDAVYSVSVFTHLPESMQFAWVEEMHRIMVPGGILVASFHGEHYWSRDPEVAAEVATKGFAYRTGEVTAGLPDFYMVAYHSIEYITQQWSPWFEVVDHHRQHIDGAHDAAVLRRRPA